MSASYYSQAVRPWFSFVIVSSELFYGSVRKTLAHSGTVPPRRPRMTIMKCPYCRHRYETIRQVRDHVEEVHPEEEHP